MNKLMIYILCFIISETYAFELDGLPACENGPLEDSSDFAFVDEMNWFEILLGIAIIFFSFVCFVPQIYKILKRRDGSGLSPSFLLILAFNQVFAVINATITNSPTMHSCTVIGWKLCLPPLLSYFQICELMILCYPMFALFLVFYKDKKEKGYKRSLIYFISACIFLVFSIILILTCLKLWGECSKITYAVGFCFGVGSTVTTLIEYLPQIWRTFRTKECGSMSFTTNWVTTVGTGIITFYMIFSTGQHFTTLASYIASLIQHIVLCALQIKYDYIDKCTVPMAKNEVKKKVNIFRKLFHLPLYPVEEEMVFNHLPQDNSDEEGCELVQTNKTESPSNKSPSPSTGSSNDTFYDLDKEIIGGDSEIVL
ncbi:hypothetical protein ENUP19_0161G0038 [Entamoeba nuttalli]